jgi:two-component system NtrC family sensor kinase
MSQPVSSTRIRWDSTSGQTSAALEAVDAVLDRSTETEIKPASNGQAENRRILILDDNAAIHEDFRKILCPAATQANVLDELEAELFDGPTATSDSQVSFDLTCASQGQEGAALVRAAKEAKAPYAMAFVDIRMPPGWDGIETVKHLWEHDSDLQVVFCTAYSDYAWEDMMRALDRSDQWLVLKKPFDNLEARQLALALTEKWNLTQREAQRLRELARTVQERTSELHDAHAHLLQADKMASIGQLAAGVAHEINNPIGFIASNLNSLKHYGADLRRLLAAYQKLVADLAAHPETAPASFQQVLAVEQEIDAEYTIRDLDDVVDESIEGTERITRIVADLRDFSHIDTQDVAEVDLNALLDKTVNVARNELKYKAEIIREYADLPPVPCIGGKIGQVFLNLLVNAAHAIAEQGTVTLRTGVEGEQCWVEVEDTGCGIPREHLSRLFEPFFTTKEVGKGTGMGLHLAYKIIEAHGGRIQVRSTVDVGSTFRLELPLAGPPNSEDNDHDL